MRGEDSHGDYANYNKSSVIASANVPDDYTVGGYVHYMAVCHHISCLVGDYLYHSYIRLWIRAGDRHRDNQNACDRFCAVHLACSFGLDCSMAGNNQNHFKRRLSRWK